MSDKLQIINVQNCSLISLKSILEQCHQLKFLNAMSNQLKVIVPTDSQLPLPCTLEELLLRDNQISSLYSLKMISRQDNTNVISLKILDISKNHFKSQVKMYQQLKLFCNQFDVRKRPAINVCYENNPFAQILMEHEMPKVDGVNIVKHKQAKELSNFFQFLNQPLSRVSNKGYKTRRWSRKCYYFFIKF